MKKIVYVTTLASTINAFFVPQINFLTQHGYEIDVIATPNFDLKGKLDPRVNFIPVEIPRGVSVYKTIKAILSIIEILKETKYDLVQYSTPNAAFCMAIASKIMKVKVRNYHLMGFRFLTYAGIKRVLFKTLEKLTCLLSTHIECVSKSNMELGVQERVFSEDKVTVVGNGSSGGVNIERFTLEKRLEWRKKIRKQLNIKDNEFVFLFAGRITKDKGINEIIEAFQTVENSSKLIFVGDAEGIETLDERLWQWALQSKNVIIHDRVSEIEEFFAAADVLLLPSYREGFGNVIIEAAAVGTPSIVSNIPGPSEIVNNIGGIVCNCRDANDLAQKMQYVISEKNIDVIKIANNAIRFYGSEDLNKAILVRKELLLNYKSC